MTSKLQRELEDLYGLERRTHKFDLAGTRALLGALGNPQRRFRAIHVAGTNGKGTTCALVERALREAGVRTGLFTSPHLVDFRERIRVSGCWVDEGWLEERLAHYLTLPEAQGRTFFEITTALGFEWFAARAVEWAVVETGLGGRLDCTNVLVPEVCAITSIGIDHAELLGDTVEAIAAEKAGIIKPGVPVVLGPLDPHARRVIEQRAAAAGSPIVTAGRDRRSLGDTRTSGAGRSHDGRLSREPMKDLNRDVAAAIIDLVRARGVALADPAIERGFERARWPGRLEASLREPRLFWDGAHNPDGARTLAALARTLDVETLVLTLSCDKDAGAMLDALAPLFPAGRKRSLIATRYASERSQPPEQIEQSATALGWTVVTAGDVAAACHHALRSTSGPVLLSGSLFAIGEAMAVYGGAPEECQ